MEQKVLDTGAEVYVVSEGKITSVALQHLAECVASIAVPQWVGVNLEAYGQQWVSPEALDDDESSLPQYRVSGIAVSASWLEPVVRETITPGLEPSVRRLMAESRALYSPYLID
jgi:hypothetical protein